MATKPRSPNYPAISLQKALDYARKLYAANHLHKASTEVVAKAMGYSSLNGGSLTVIAALKKYGLIEEDNKELKISKDALTVIVEPASSPERARTLIKLASKPELFADLQATYPGSIPSDDILRAWFLRKGFLQSTVDTPIRAYRETMDLADAQRGLLADASPPAQDAPLSVETPKVGDFIQWESSGMLMFDSPRRVRGATLEGDFVFVDGSETGIPAQEVRVTQLASPSAPQLVGLVGREALPQSGGVHLAQLPGQRHDVFSLDEGQAILQWPAQMSESSYEDFKDWIELQLRKIKRSIQ